MICLYNAACFGSPFTTNYRYEAVGVRYGDRFDAGLLGRPRLDVLITILFSPYRGLFFSAPVLAMGVYGLLRLWRDRDWRREACWFSFVIVLYLWFNASFRGWHGAWIAVPRHLGPAVPFLAAPMVFGMIRFPRTSLLLGIVSVAINLLFTAVDPQVPTEFDAAVGIVPAWPQWRHAPLLDYTLPLFLTGRAGPFLDRQLDRRLREDAAEWQAAGVPAAERARRLAVRREEWETAIRNREMRGSNGPVSANPASIAECGLWALMRTGPVTWSGTRSTRASSYSPKVGGVCCPW